MEEFLVTILGIVATSMVSVANMCLGASLGYFAFLIIEAIIGTTIRTAVYKAVETLRRWITVASILAFMFGLMIKAWETPDVLYWPITGGREKTHVNGVIILFGLFIAFVLGAVVCAIFVFRRSVVKVAETNGIPIGGVRSIEREQLQQFEERLNKIQCQLEEIAQGQRSNTRGKSISSTCSAIPVAAAEGRMVVEQVPPRRIPAELKCLACGEKGVHWKQDCPYRNHRCEYCRRIGHVQKACRNFAVKDSQGRVKQLVEMRENKIQTASTMDRHTADRVLTAQDVLNSILEMSKKRARRAKTKRTEKNRGKERKRRVIDHPVGASSSSRTVELSDQSSSSSDEDESMGEIVEMLTSLAKHERGEEHSS